MLINLLHCRVSTAKKGKSSSKALSLLTTTIMVVCAHNVHAHDDAHTAIVLQHRPQRPHHGHQALPPGCRQHHTALVPPLVPCVDLWCGATCPISLASQIQCHPSHCIHTSSQWSSASFPTY